MNIIAGKYKGRRLKYDAKGVRPTQDRVKEAVFSMLGGQFDGYACLDMFSGSGSLGLEALSRGASRVDCVDRDIDLLLLNSQWVPETEGFNVFKRDVFNFLESCKERYDVVFVDPPWDFPEAYQRSLLALREFAILKPTARIVLEHRDTSLDLSDFECIKQKKMGRTSISIIKEKHE